MVVDYQVDPLDQYICQYQMDTTSTRKKMDLFRWGFE